MENFFSAKSLFKISILFIVYATTIPWDIDHLPSSEGISLIPGWDSNRDRLASIPDMVQNIILFMPLGFFAVFSKPNISRKNLISGSIYCGMIGLSLSLFVEILQTMSATRNPSTTDLLTNFTGAMAGGWAALFYLKHFQKNFENSFHKTLKEQPGLIILILFTIAILADTLTPFVPTLDLGSLKHNIKSFVENPWGTKSLTSLLPDILLWCSFGFISFLELPAYLAGKSSFRFMPKQKDSADFFWPIAVILSFLIIGLETAQILIIDHSPSLQDLFFGAAAMLAGGKLSAFFKDQGLKPAARLGDTCRQLPRLMLGFALLAPTLRALYPYKFMPLEESLPQITLWNFVPFAIFFTNINLSTFYNVFEASAIYLPLGYVTRAFGCDPKFSFICCLSMAIILEFLQIPVVDRTFDITEGIFAGGMGMYGAFLLQKSSEDFQKRPDKGHIL